jgi:hypothetical protein
MRFTLPSAADAPRAPGPLRTSQGGNPFDHTRQATPLSRSPTRGYPGPLCVIQDDPFRFLMVADNLKYLIDGKPPAPCRRIPSTESPTPVLQLGPADAYDGGYAGIGSVHHDMTTGRLVGFYHAEDRRDMGRVRLEESAGSVRERSAACGPKRERVGQGPASSGSTTTARSGGIAGGIFATAGESASEGRLDQFKTARHASSWPCIREQ